VNDHSPTILVTERNANILDLLRREFEREGFIVHVAADAASLRERLTNADRYALAVLDEDLPSAGLEPALAMILRLAPGLPVILHAFPGAGEGGQAEGAARLVEKSGEFESLKRAVSDMIATRSAAKERTAGG